MIKKIIKFLYAKYPHRFSEVMIDDLMGKIPSNGIQPSSSFFTTAGKKIEEFLLWESWIIQKKASGDPKNIAFYHGIMFHIKTQLLLVSRGKTPEMKAIPPEIEEVKDPIEGVDAFVKGMSNKK